MGNGWAAWDETRPARQTLVATGADQIRYCPRCDQETVWHMGANANHPELPSCVCGVTVAAILTGGELDRVYDRYGD